MTKGSSKDEHDTEIIRSTPTHPESRSPAEQIEEVGPAPGGSVLLVFQVSSPEALAAIEQGAATAGATVSVVTQRPANVDLGELLSAAKYVRTTDFFEWRPVVTDAKVQTFDLAEPANDQPQHDIINRAQQVLQDDLRVEAAWLAGSYARGNADVYSDVDIHCLIADDSADWFRDLWPQTAAAIMPLVMHQSIPGVVGGLALSPDWQRLDFIFHPVGATTPWSTSWPISSRPPTGSTPPTSHGWRSGCPLSI